MASLHAARRAPFRGGNRGTGNGGAHRDAASRADRGLASAMRHAALDTPLGPLLLVSDGGALTQATFDGTPPPASRPETDAVGCADLTVLEDAARALASYFRGEPVAFRVPLRLGGTPFQERVWAALADVPWGETVSYGTLASRLGVPLGAQAVGAANGANPAAVVVPCHRVVGADGALVGYAGGLERKRALLELESRQTKLF